ncbi:cobalt-precorrin-6 synthase, anaerobic [hydrocarbon metagenome]|uniref:Cobalt-precorrin-6 synthase, anaerobic n=1 Tax=hydrocarbon metagenome TaxID=938273 RepID=A0A0W8EAB3_9ZZZZ
MKQLSSRRNLRSGYTTGACASAAAYAALYRLLTGDIIEQVEVDLPRHGKISIPVRGVILADGRAVAEVIKDAGDDPDVTHGLSILSAVELKDGPGIIIKGGCGVGKVTRPGLSVNVGEAAINPGPRQMILSMVKKLLPMGKGAEIIISVPEGEKVAVKTLNPRLGIVGGISILGTSGIVRPMSNQGYLNSLIPQLDQAVAMAQRLVILTPGEMGARKARDMGFPETAIIQTSNFIGDMLRECGERPIDKIILLGHIGKIIKVAAGIYNTHSKIADGRRETLAAHVAMLGASPELIQEIMRLNTIEASLELIRAHKLEGAYYSIADWSSRRCRELLPPTTVVGTIMYSLNGDIIAYDDQGLKLWEEKQ